MVEDARPGASRVSRRRFLGLAGAGAGALAVSVSGCGGLFDGPEATAPTDPTPTPGATPAPTAVPTPAVPADARTLTIAQGFQIRGFDAHLVTAWEEQAITNAVFDTLVGRDPVTMEPIPRLATEWTAVDDHTWEFRLRDDVRFHNGEPFDAETVQFNVDRIKDEELGSWLDGSLGRLIDSVEVVNGTTVRLITVQPVAVLLDRLARFFMVPPAAVTDEGDEWLSSNPVGTGAYRFVSWETADHVTLERSDEYFGYPGDRQPQYDSLVFRTILEPATAMSELLAGGVDIIDGVAADQVDNVNNSGVATVVTHESPGKIWLRLDALGRGRDGDTPLSDPRVRRAMLLAIDRQTILDTLQGGYGELIDHPVDATQFGYTEIEPASYDPDQARALLDEAGYPDDFVLDIALYPLSGFRDHTALMEGIAAYFQDVGMASEINRIDPSQLAELRNDGRIGDVSPGRSGGPEFDGIGSFLNIRAGRAGSYYESEEFEELLQSAEETLDDGERAALIEQAQHLWAEELPGLILFSVPHMLGVNNSVDFQPTAEWPQTPMTLMGPA